jgi:PIN domain nuclease of toxin-antitoxin system
MNAGVFLVDTHTLLWALSEPQKLGSLASEILKDPNHRILVSVATLWELSIKVTVGKLELPNTFFNDLFPLGFERLSISDAHLAAYRKRPLLHGNPFDRLLVAQTQVEKLILLTCDSEIPSYEIDWVW